MNYINILGDFISRPPVGISLYIAAVLAAIFWDDLRPALWLGLCMLLFPFWCATFWGMALVGGIWRRFNESQHDNR